MAETWLTMNEYEEPFIAKNSIKASRGPTLRSATDILMNTQKPRNKLNIAE